HAALSSLGEGSAAAPDAAGDSSAKEQMLVEMEVPLRQMLAEMEVLLPMPAKMEIEAPLQKL
ncbi:unnamed protein product, partial [Polarella glacialis]